MSSLVSVKAIAEDILGVKSPVTVMRLAARGAIPVVRVSSRLLRFNPDAVRAALQKMETATK